MQSELTEQLVVFGLPAEHLPWTAAHFVAAFEAVQATATFEQVPDFWHCVVGFVVVVQVGLSLPAGQVPRS